MISVGFTSNYNNEDLTKLSVISEPDSFIFGLFNDDNTLLAAGRKNHDEYLSFINEYNHLSKFYLSKSNAFTHIHKSKINDIENLMPFKDQMNNEDIFTLYEDEWLEKVNIHTSKHISSAIQSRFKYADTPICYIHFNKGSIIICVCGNVGFKFFNEFEIENAEDIIYFTKSVLQTLQIDEEKVILKLSGYIEEGYLFYKMLLRYFHNLEFATAYNFQVNENAGKEHYYFDHYLNIAF